MLFLAIFGINPTFASAQESSAVSPRSGLANGMVNCWPHDVTGMTAVRPHTISWLPDKVHLNSHRTDAGRAYTYDNGGESWKPTVYCNGVKIAGKNWLPGGNRRYDFKCWLSSSRVGKCYVNNSNTEM